MSVVRRRDKVNHIVKALPKCPTGIQGFDEITGGGLPRGRPTLVCGGAGCGKTLLAMEFLVCGAREFDEPGVFMSFEETAEELTKNFASLGFDLNALAARKKISLDYVRIERSDLETGEYDLEGLFIRLGHAIDSIHAKRVVLDSVESLFAGLSNALILRAELHRLSHWLKDKAVTAIITGERGEGALTRQGLEEYVSDCVIALDHSATGQVSTRRLRVVKYRGSTHGTNDYPFLIDETGISVMPVTSLGLRHAASTEHVSTGIPRLDTMLDGKGYYRGSSVLVSGTAGTGKTSICAHFVDAACQRGERSLYLAFEESASQITRNMCSIGIHLEPWVKKGLLQFHAARPTLFGLEMHLAMLHKVVIAFRPSVIVLDPIDAFTNRENAVEVKLMLMRLMDFLKGTGITTLLANLSSDGDPLEHTELAISSLIDTWVLVRDLEVGGERNRVLHVLKSRGMRHSNQIREFLLTDHGVELRDVYVGPSGVLTGSARLVQEARDKATELVHLEDVEQKRLELDGERKAMEAQIAALSVQFKAKETAAFTDIGRSQARYEHLAQDRKEMARSRQADAVGTAADTRRKKNRNQRRPR